MTGPRSCDKRKMLLAAMQSTCRPVRPTTFGLLGVAGLLALACSGCGSAEAQNGFPSFRNLVKKVAPSVVNISVTEGDAAGDDGTSHVGRHHPAAKRMLGAGSGFIIDPSGYIVTNDHVVDHATEVTVTTADGEDASEVAVGAVTLGESRSGRRHAGSGGHGHLQAVDRCQRRVAHRQLHQDAHVHAVDDGALT